MMHRNAYTKKTSKMLLKFWISKEKKMEEKFKFMIHRKFLIYYLIKKILYNWKFVIFLQSWGLEACNEKMYLMSDCSKNIQHDAAYYLIYKSFFKWIGYQRGLWCHTPFNVQMVITSNGAFLHLWWKGNKMKMVERSKMNNIVQIKQVF